jgi:hypothetical protein
MSNPWDRRTCGTAALSILLASGVALSVCAAKGDLDTKAPVASVSPVQSPTAAPTTCGSK